MVVAKSERASWYSARLAETARGLPAKFRSFPRLHAHDAYRVVLSAVWVDFRVCTWQLLDSCGQRGCHESSKLNGIDNQAGTLFRGIPEYNLCRNSTCASFSVKKVYSLNAHVRTAWTCKYGAPHVFGTVISGHKRCSQRINIFLRLPRWTGSFIRWVEIEGIAKLSLLSTRRRRF